MVHASIKTVVGCLLVAVSVVTVVIALIPFVIHLQRNGMDLVVSASGAAADEVQAVVTRQLTRAEFACKNLIRSSKAMDPLVNMDIGRIVELLGSITTELNVGAGIERDDGTGLYVDPTIALVPVTPLPGYVFVTNHTVPGSYSDIGQFSIYPPHESANPMQPWTRIPLPGVNWWAALGAADLVQRQLFALQWMPVFALNSSSGIESTFFYGGIFQQPDQHYEYAFVILRGAWLKYFSNVTLWSTGAVVLFDAASNSFIAGNVDDPSGKLVNGSAALKSMTDLRDPRVATITTAFTPTEKGGGLEAILSCSPPCLFTYWPHNHQLHDNNKAINEYTRVLGALFYEFTLVRVVDVLRQDNNTATQGGGGRPSIDVRLLVTIPSREIIGRLMKQFRWNLLFIGVILVAMCGVLVIGSSIAFQSLTAVEKEMQRMSKVFVISPSVATISLNADGTMASSANGRGSNAFCDGRLLDDDDNDNGSGAGPVEFPKSTFTEFTRLFEAVHLLHRQLYTLRSFSTVCMTTTAYGGGGGGCVTGLTSGAAPSTGSSSMPTSDVASHHTHSGESIHSHYGAESIPYTTSVTGRLWRVPVTTVAVQISNAAFDTLSCDHVAVHNRCNTAHNILFQELSHFPGASIDIYIGDYALVHFNAAARCPTHGIAAMQFVRRCFVRLELLRSDPNLWGAMSCKNGVTVDRNVRSDDDNDVGGPLLQYVSATKSEWRPPAYFGISSMLSHCGYLGTNSFKTFTVLSAGEPQAAFMGTIARSKGIVAAATWRAVHLARQQMQTVNLNAPKHHNHHPHGKSSAVVARGAEASSSPLEIDQNGSSRQPCAVVGTGSAKVHFDFVPLAKVVLPGDLAGQATFVFAPVL